MNCWNVGGVLLFEGSRSQLFMLHVIPVLRFIDWRCNVCSVLTIDSLPLFRTCWEKSYACILVITADIVSTCLVNGKWFSLRVPWASLIEYVRVGDLFNCSGSGMDLTRIFFNDCLLWVSNSTGILNWTY